MATAGSIVIDLLMRTGSFETDTKRAEKALRDFQKSAVSFSKGLGTAVAAGAVAAGAALAALTARAIEQADKIDELSARFNVATETLSTWGYAAARSGTSLEALAGAVPKLSKAMVEALDQTSKAADLFRALGVDVLDPLTGKVRKVEDVLPELADVFKALDDDATEAALAMQLFGRSGTELLEFLNRGSSGIAELQERARALGVEIDGNTAAAAARFKDQLDDLQSLADGFGLTLASKLAPALADTVSKFDDFVRQGELAANLVTVIDGAMQAGLAAINAYNIAVERTGILFEIAARSGKGAWEAYKNFATLGLADGSVANGLRELWNAPSEGTEQAERLAALREAAANRRAFEDDGVRRVRGGGSMGEASRRLGAPVETASAAAIRSFFEGGDSGKPRRTAAAKATKDELDETAQILKDLEMLERVWADASAEVTQEAVRRTEQFERANQDILDQIDLLGMTRDQQEAWNQLAWAGVDAESERGKQLLANVERLQQMREATFDVTDAMDSLRDAGSDFFVDWTSGAKSFKDAALDALDSLNQRILQMIADNLMDQLFGKRGDTGGGQWGDLVGSVFSSIFGGADGFASGGYTGAGGKNKVAGLVHKGEYVFSADAVSRLGLDFLSGLDRGWIGEAGEEQRCAGMLLMPPVQPRPFLVA